MTTLLWLRQDLRLHDQPALVAAAQQGPVIPVYILDDDAPGAWRIGGAQRWWLHHSLAAVDKALRDQHSRLILRRGNAVSILEELAEATGAEAIHAIRHYEPWWRKAEAALGERLCLHDGNHLAPPEQVKTGSGGQFRIYSAFWKGLQEHLPPEKPVPAPSEIPAPKRWPKSDKLADWQLLPTKPNWSGGFDWTPGEEEARRKIADLDLEGYDDRRNLPAEEGTSRLSPHLHFGEVSPRAVWHATGAHDVTFRKELAWRDFTDGVVLALPDYADM
jgi:deoxyribodipyrimidine photo-lyase